MVQACDAHYLVRILVPIEISRRLAGLVGSFALALDVSTIAAIANNTFSKSHAALARGQGQNQSLGSSESKL